MHKLRFLIQGLVSVAFMSIFIVLATTETVTADPINDQDFFAALVKSAIKRTQHQIIYDGSYRKIAYPMGDVPNNIGVCTDVVIRSYRGLGIDLQRLVHEDMQQHFNAYPNHWGLKKPDTNIDHRRVPNLQTFFKRHGVELAVSANASDYQPGDLVTWMLPGNLPHIGIVTHLKSEDKERPLIVHNIGQGTTLEDMLYEYRITGHYRFKPAAE